MPARVAGYFALTADLRLSGWCWNPGQPADRLTVDVTVNGAVVRSLVASQMNDEVRAMGIGDGRYGFSLSIPAEAADRNAIVEARERRSGLILGRVLFGGLADPAGVAALDRLEHEIGGWLGRLRAPDPRRDWIGRACERFGAALAGERRLARAPPRSEPIHPLVSVLLLGGNDTATRDALEHAALMLPDSEALVMTDDRGVDARQVIRVGGGLAHACNAAAIRARGRFLCLVDAPDEFVAVGLPDLLHDAAPALLGSGAAGAMRHSAAHWLPAGAADGIAVVLRRETLFAAGGFDPLPDGGIDWHGLAAKLHALGVRVEARPVRSRVEQRVPGV